MNIPENFKESQRSQKFRMSQSMCIAYKLIDLDSESRQHNVTTIIDIRVFWPKYSQTCSAVIWINDLKNKRYGWGVGIARGYGYHHESAAIEDAFGDMGIKFESKESFGSTGTGEQENAIRKVGAALGYENTLLVDFNP